MRAVMASIKPRHTSNILVGLKTVELRKTGPGATPFRVYVYETLDGGKGSGEVVCEFVCDRYVGQIFDVRGNVRRDICTAACVTEEEILAYARGGNICGWHISELIVYNEPVPLWAFKGLRRVKFKEEPYVMQRPPQSWCYVEANNGYCPCAIWKTPDTKCMCRDFREQNEPGECYCGRFEKVAAEDDR